MDKEKWFNDLSEAGSHSWLKFEWAQKCASAFGVKIFPEKQRANTGEFKGLEVPGVAPNTVVEGYAAVDLAEAIADSFPGTDLPRTYRMQEGRGFRFRSALETIRAGLDKEKSVGLGKSGHKEV